jgi:hypothetical protein
MCQLPLPGGRGQPGQEPDESGDPRGRYQLHPAPGRRRCRGAELHLSAGDFPFHRLSDPTDRNSTVTFDTNDIVSSQGTFDGGFVTSAPLIFPDICGAPDTSVFHVGSQAVRKVEPRNTPTVFNAAFNFRNFWDGRANNRFNGVSRPGKRRSGGVPEAAAHRRSGALGEGPFDHPELLIPNGQLGNESATVDLLPLDGKADDTFTTIAPTGGRWPVVPARPDPTVPAVGGQSRTAAGMGVTACGVENMRRCKRCERCAHAVEPPVRVTRTPGLCARCRGGSIAAR